MKQFGSRVILSVVALVAICAPITFGQDAPRPIAEVNGQPIYEQDLMTVAGPKLLELRNQGDQRA